MVFMHSLHTVQEITSKWILGGAFIQFCSGPV